MKVGVVKGGRRLTQRKSKVICQLFLQSVEFQGLCFSFLSLYQFNQTLDLRFECSLNSILFYLDYRGPQFTFLVHGCRHFSGIDIMSQPHIITNSCVLILGQ